MKQQHISPEEALERLETLCARSEQCSFDISQKLYRWNIDTRATREIIDSLHKHGFIDDLRFARAFVRDKYRFSAWGRAKIRAALIARRIVGHDIDTALTEIDARQYQLRAFAAVKARLRSLDKTDIAACRLKLMRFGLSRGYEASLVTRILESRKLWVDD